MYTIFTTDNLDPWYNLSIENWLLNRKDLACRNILFIWRNRPSIIIGRFQNPWLECRLKEMKNDEISFVRRPSGGGAVYHDEGNSNFTFISPKENFSRTEKTNLIVKTLASLNIKAVQGRRYDIYVNGKKVSGSASKFTSGKVIHHGTLLIKADLEALDNYLKSNYYQSNAIKSKGIDSVRSKVTNLSELNPSLNHDQFSNALINILTSNQKEHFELINLNIKDLNNIEEIQSFREKLMSWDWLFGNTPGFSLEIKIPYSGIDYDCSINVKKGLIINIETENKDLHDRYIGQPCNKLFL